MSNIYDSRQRWKLDFIFIAILITMVSAVVSDLLIRDLVREERQKIEVWGEAIRVTTSGNPSLNMSLVLGIIQGDTSIPVILCSETDGVVSYDNIETPEKNVAQFMANEVKKLRIKNSLIVIDMEDGIYQYLYHDDPIILKRLLVYLYAQLSVVLVFILTALLALVSAKKVERNKVWMRLSGETACQLGTPISSLIAWVRYLRTRNIGPSLLIEMDKDVERLQTIAGRFPKIDLDLDPVPINIVESIHAILGHMETRISSKAKIGTYLPERLISVLTNDSLFAWVIENLTKNAVDAMEGQGEISLKVEEREEVVLIDLVDTREDIPKSKFKTVFNPGYTIKRRGWGLGPSLVKRIIKSFQGGKIFVKSLELGKGTASRIKLKKYEG